MDADRWWICVKILHLSHEIAFCCADIFSPCGSTSHMAGNQLKNVPVPRLWQALQIQVSAVQAVPLWCLYEIHLAPQRTCLLHLSEADNSENSLGFILFVFSHGLRQEACWNVIAVAWRMWNEIYQAGQTNLKSIDRSGGSCHFVWHGPSLSFLFWSERHRLVHCGCSAAMLSCWWRTKQPSCANSAPRGLNLLLAEGKTKQGKRIPDFRVLSHMWQFLGTETYSVFAVSQFLYLWMLLSLLATQDEQGCQYLIANCWVI